MNSYRQVKSNFGHFLTRSHIKMPSKILCFLQAHNKAMGHRTSKPGPPFRSFAATFRPLVVGEHLFKFARLCYPTDGIQGDDDERHDFRWLPVRGDPVRNECRASIPAALPLYRLPDGQRRCGLRCVRGAHRQSRRHTGRTCLFRCHGGLGQDQLTAFLPDLRHARLGGTGGNGDG